MSRASNRADGDIVRTFRSVAALLEEPQLAQLYAYLAREDGATVQVVMDDLEIPHGTAYRYVNRLVDTSVDQVTHDEQPRRYAIRDIDPTVTRAAGDREYTVTPTLIEAVGRGRDQLRHRHLHRPQRCRRRRDDTHRRCRPRTRRGYPLADGRQFRPLATGRRDHPAGATPRRPPALRNRSERKSRYPRSGQRMRIATNDREQVTQRPVYSCSVEKTDGTQ